MREASDSIAIEITAAAQSANSAINGLQQTLGKYNTAIANGSKNAKNFSNSLATLALKSTVVIYVLRRIVNVLGGLFKANGDYIEAVNLFRVTMGDAASEAMKYADEVERLVGINKQDWFENQGSFQQLIVGFGIGADKASIMSKNLTQLGYDLSSVFNTDVETAMQKLQSGMAGMVKGLRSYGIETSVAALEEYALSKGITQSVMSMSMAEKTLLRYNLIMERSINIQGDMARTLVSPSNALRILGAQWDVAKRQMGAIVSVIATQVIPVFQAIVQIISQAAAAIAAFFGYNINDYLADLSGLGSNEWGAGAEDVEDALAGGAGSAKKIKDYMMGFDELNVIKPEEPTGGVGVGGVGGGGFDIELYDNANWLDGLTERTDELIGKIKELLPVVTAVGTGLLAWNIIRSLSKVSLINTTFLGALKIAAAIALIAGGIIAVVQGIKSWIENGELLNKDAQKLALGFLAIGAGIAILTGSWIPLAIGAVVALVAIVIGYWDEIKAFFAGIWNGIVEIWNTAAAWFHDNVAQPIIDFFAPAVEFISQLFTGCWIIIQAVWQVVSTWFNENVITPLVNFFSPIIKTISGVFTAIWNTIKVVWGAVANWFNNTVIEPLKKNFSAAWTFISDTFSTVFKGIANFAIGIFNGVITAIEGFLNFTIRAINSFLSGFNSLVQGAASIIGTSWGGITLLSEVSLSRIPAFANGGFPEDGAFFANSGELVGQFSNGKTAVANNDQIIAGIQQGVYAAVVSAMSETNGNGDYDFNIYISGKQVEAEVEKVKKERGATILSGGVAYAY